MQGVLGKHGIICIEDLIHELYTVGPHFKEANNFLHPFQLSCARGAPPRMRFFLDRVWCSAAVWLLCTLAASPLFDGLSWPGRSPEHRALCTAVRSVCRVRGSLWGVALMAGGCRVQAAWTRSGGTTSRVARRATARSRSTASCAP